MKLEEKLFRRRRVYTGKAVNFAADEIVLPDGSRACREYMEHPGAVAVLPFVDPARIILVRQYRYPVGTATYEVPAGKLDKGETLRACVRRELAEETGFRARRITKLLHFWPTPAFATEVIHVFAASDLVPSPLMPDHDEFIQTRVVPFTTALEWVFKGRIRDSKTVIALLFWAGQTRRNG